eukprot:CFRG2667T1
MYLLRYGLGIPFQHSSMYIHTLHASSIGFQVRNISTQANMEAKAFADNPTPWYMVISNVAKKKNSGNLIRSAAAFGAKQVFVVGRKKDLVFFGAHGSQRRVEIVFFESLISLKKHCVDKEITVCGIEIGEGAEAVDKHPFRGPTAFIVGNEGHGMEPREIEICDHLVYISQYGDGTASLNVCVAGSIVFHHFCLWAKYKEMTVTDAKFDVNEEPLIPYGQLSEADIALREARRRAREEKAAACAEAAVEE